MKRSTLIVLIVGCLINAAFSQNDPIIRFGLIADVQYCDCETNGSRFYRNSLGKLESAVVDLNKQQVQFTINLGDLVDRNPEDMDAVLERQQVLDGEVYNTLGNHDYEGISDNKKLFRKLGMPNDYYSFKKESWRFIMLNTNEIAAYSNMRGKKKEKELADMLENIHKRNRNNGKDWNGGVSNKQLKWLKKLLRKSQSNNENVLVFSHHPFYPAEGFTALNDQEVLDTVSEFSCVKGLISGHHHVGAFDFYEDIPCITVEGMVETKRENAYAIVDIYEDKLLISGEGRAKSYELNLR